MTPGILVMSAALVALVAGFVAFYVYSGTERWHHSETKQAALGFLITIAPMFGGRVQRPKPEIPVVMTPGPDQTSIPGVSTVPAGMENGSPSGGDGEGSQARPRR